MTRHDGRDPDQLREIRITRNWLDHAEGSVLVEFGRTRVLCAASFTAGVPRWSSHPRVFLPLAESGKARCPYCGTEFVLID